MHEQLDAYRNEEEPNQEAYERICQVLQQIALEEIGQTLEAPAAPAPTVTQPSKAESSKRETPEEGETHLLVALLNVNDKDRTLLVEELEQLGISSRTQAMTSVTRSFSKVASVPTILKP